jgi:hypothetical protein
MQNILEVYNTLHTRYETTQFKMDDTMRGTTTHNIKCMVVLLMSMQTWIKFKINITT